MNLDFVLRELMKNDAAQDRAFNLMMRQECFSDRYSKSKMLWLKFMGRVQALAKIYFTGVRGR